MTAYNFGVGAAIGKRTDIANAKPSFLGTLQDLEIDIAVTLKELTGSYAMPVDVAPANMKITGKAKFARIQGASINNLLLGMTETDAAGIDMATAEPGTVPGTSTYIITTSHSGAWLEDLGVFYANGSGQLQPVAVLSGSAAGQYTVAAGVYTFASGDASAAVVIYYSYTATTLVSIAGVNRLMGTGPVFELHAKQDYFVQGVEKKLIIKLNACRASKWNMPFKNTDYTITDFEFTAFADASNNWGTLAFSE